MLALFNLSGGEIVLILALVIVLFVAKRLPELARGLADGWREFRKAFRRVGDEIDGQASDAGRSLGGIYGKPAAQALTPDNLVAELYDPAAFEGEPSPKLRLSLFRVFGKLWRWMVKALNNVSDSTGETT